MRFSSFDKKSNSIHMLWNDYSRKTNTFSTDMGTVLGSINCQEHNGTGLFDLSVRFADLDVMYHDSFPHTLNI